MSNEFNIKNGFISNDNSRVIGGFTALTISAGTYYGDISWNGGPVTNTAYFQQGLSGTSISANTFYGNGANLTGVVAEFTGGTVIGNTIFTNGLTANTLNVTGNTNLTIVTATTISGVTNVRSTSISATTYQNLPVSGLTSGTNISVTGANGNFTITFTGTTGSNFTGGTVSGGTIFTNGVTANTLNVTGSTTLPNLTTTASSITLTSLTPGTIISSLGVDDTGKIITGQTASNFTGGTVSGQTLFTGGLSGTSISGDSFYLSSLIGSSSTLVGWDSVSKKLVLGSGGGGSAAPITGGTYNPVDESITFVNNTGGTVYVTGFKVYTDRRTYYSYPYQYSGSAPRGTAEGDSIWIIRRIAFSSVTPTIEQKVGTWTDKENPSGYSPY